MRVAFIICLTLFLPQAAGADKVWQEANAGLSDLAIRTVSLFPGDSRFVCAASPKTVYLSQDFGTSWQPVFSLKTEENEITFVKFHDINPRNLYAATTKGLFATEDGGENWQKVFGQISTEANSVNCLASDALNAERIYIGTEAGLYLTDDAGKTWLKAGGGLPQLSVSSIAVHPDNSYVLYLANPMGLYKSQDSAKSWKRIYVTSYKATDEDDEEDEEEESEQVIEEQNLINCLAINQGYPKTIFFATGSGVFSSTDAGASWNRLPVQGLSCDYINFIVVNGEKEATVFAASKNGVFQFLPDAGQWQRLYQGLTAREIYSLALVKEPQQLFAGTDRGVFKTIDHQDVRQGEPEQVTPSDEKGFDQVLHELSLREPTITAVQEAALRYAEVVHPKSIKTLRRNAKLKALLPDVSLGYNKTIYGTAGTNTYDPRAFVGPRDWALSLSWDVGDLVYSEQVRLIDSNARLLVQLRDDILNEVTRLYYERRKLQTKLVLMPPQTPQDKLNQTLRLQELTANIDALTGGYFSRQLNKQATEPPANNFLD